MRFLTDLPDTAVNDKLVIGSIRAPHGIHGALSIRCFVGNWEEYTALTCCILSKNGIERLFPVRCLHTNNSHTVLKFQGIDSIEQAKQWSNANILLERQYAKPCNIHEYYFADLINIRVIHNHALIGIVTAVFESSNCELLEISCNNSTNKLVPFLEYFFSDVDLQRKEVELKHAWILE